MTNDPNDLVSAYIDGEATPDEVARVDDDPGLQAEVEAMRALSAEMVVGIPSPSPSVRARHLDAAGAAFDQLLAGGPAAGAVDQTKASDGAVIDLDARRGQGRTRRGGRAVAAGQARSPWPTRLVGAGAAAALLAVVGVGLATLASNGIGVNTSDDAATEADGDDGGGDDDDDASFALADADADADAETSTEMADEAMEEADSSEDSADDESADADDSEGEQEATTGRPLTDGGETDGESRVQSTEVPPVDPDALLLSFAQAPNETELETIGQGELAEPASSACAGAVGFPFDGPFIGYIPIKVAGQPGEVLVFEDDNGTRSTTAFTIADDNSCIELEP